MNETFKVIKNRRSIRTFKPEQISDSDLHEILEAALLAPNAMNQQNGTLPLYKIRICLIKW